MRDAEPRSHGGATELDVLVESLGTDLVELVAAGHLADVGLGDPVIYDGSERSALRPGAIVLAVGVPPDGPEAERLLREAGQARASAVVFKRSGEIGALRQLAATAAVAVLTVAEEMTWTQLHGLLSNVRRFSTRSDAEDGIAGVPVGDLFALANAIAGMVGGAVTIEDPARRVLAYSTLGDQPIDTWRQDSILGRQVPDSPGMRRIYRRMLETDGVMTAGRAALRELLQEGPREVATLEARSAVAIRAGGHAIGSIWVIHEDGPLGEDAVRALAEAARIAAPHLIHARASRDVERRIRGELLVAILEGRGAVEESAARLGLTPGASFTVLAFSTATDREIDRFERERLVDLVGVYCEALHGPSGVVAIGGNVYALLQDEQDADRERVLRVAREVQGQTEGKAGAPILAAVSSTVERLRDVAAARREAEQVLEVLRTRAGERTLATVDEVRSEVILLELAELGRENPGLLRGKLAALLDHDAERGTQYAATLRAYLDAMGDVASASARVSVHPNTFRYRIRRLRELFDLDLENADERVVLELQLRLLGGA
jgi:sugar diacid utilization regulator